MARTQRQSHSPPSRIVSDPEVLAGKPRIRGTRIAVELVLEMLADGAPVEEILDCYPHLSREDVQACLEYAVRMVRTSRRKTPRDGQAKIAS